MRLLDRLRQHVAQRELEIWAVVFPTTVLEHRQHAAHAVFPDCLLVFHLPIERAEFGDARALAHAEFDAAVAHEVQARNFLRHAGGVVGGELDDAVSEPDLLGALGCGGEEDLGLRRVGVFF